MARPSRYGASDLLDAAVRLAAEGGPAAVTMAAVAKSVGAPSGSVYHRFADRPALLSELWLRTLDNFQSGFLSALESTAPRTAAMDAARHTVCWARDHPAEARVLRYNPRDFEQARWPQEAGRALQAANTRVYGAVHTLAHRLGATGQVDVERVVVAVIDVPYALVQRHLQEGSPVPSHVLETVAQCTAALLPGGGEPPS
ncbi:TetR/AcrR family transcriptional regulator [Streptomyces sp. N2-109]|uniref:TetR/AcrR family transcriptional regulator n=1 Tax=Streptomyces gossypii TaxID=2883101 RepID=A0ABT2K1L9_9ACTN|nr:TetR/AcrR family transcriptional regulator [Streptomyces gossypii]MCT2593808.1 TetR/AcrR family transcriptional regulator [Streptomyces gossypii]